MSAKNMTATDIKDWLSEIGKDRYWLGEELGLSKRTLDKWFTANEFPLYAKKHIERIMRELAQPDSLSLTLEDWKLISKAAQLTGFDDVEEYIWHSLRESSRATNASQAPKEPSGGEQD